MTTTTTNGAQIRLVYDYINAVNGTWITQMNIWVEATPYQLDQFKESVNKQIRRADRRNFRIEWRQYSTEIHTVVADVDWATFDEMLKDGDKPAANQWVLVVGNPEDGFTIIGPFSTGAEASEQGSRDASEEWWTMRLYQP